MGTLSPSRSCIKIAPRPEADASVARMKGLSKSGFQSFVVSDRAVRKSWKAAVRSGVQLRHEKGQEKTLVEWSPGLEERLWFSSQKHSALQEAIENCQEFLNQALNKVDVTLDPDTANPFLILSEDLKSVRRGSKCQHLPETPQRFDVMMCVLGQERFTSGRHWWLVEVEENLGRWAIGVAQETVQKKGLVHISPDQGLWAVASFSGERICPFFRVWKGAKLKC
ncbi:E3 ubiquitin-protein ligase TRIM7-like [Eublepharis macularius]|uniref:E3 ubiquitin-protein ligase TRIM7-like n=1 Tax=Eublepharis macularius TaxID=481883 RepID=A0AA97KVU3_EUBMA|nr:E3 ubiquitin-protein ligase TRIM7-like [Eublepharis macularius]